VYGIFIDNLMFCFRKSIQYKETILQPNSEFLTGINMAAQQLHKELTALSHNLTISDELLKKGNQHMQRIFLLLQKHSTYKLDRCRLLGGVGKKTSISVKFDYDCVIYVNDVDPPFEELLDEWDDIFIQYLTELKGETKVTRYSIQFKVEGFEFDILPAPNYTGFNHDIISQAKIIWERISKQEKISYLYSSGLSELALQFMEKQSGFIHDLCRLTKFWNFTILFDQYVSGRSCIIEYLAVKAGQEEEKRLNITNGRCMLRAFRRFLSYLIEYEQIGIVFFEFYDKNRVSIYEKPFLIDPINPYNNLLASVPDSFLPTLSKCSKETLNRLEECERNNYFEFDKVFEPQSNLPSFCTPLTNIDPAYVLVTSLQNCGEKTLKLIVRRETFDSVELSMMRDLMTYFLKYFFKTFQNVAKEYDTRKAIETTQQFIDQSFVKRDEQWMPTTQKHDDFDITFILPLNTKEQHAIYISMIR